MLLHQQNDVRGALSPPLLSEPKKQRPKMLPPILDKPLDLVSSVLGGYQGVKGLTKRSDGPVISSNCE